MFTFTVIAAALAISTGINIIASIISWLRAKTRFGYYFAVGITSHALWTLASTLDYAAIPIPLKIFFAKWEYLFYNTAHAFFLLFLLVYVGYIELANSKLLRAILWIGCSINILLAWTNDWHGWLWSGFSPGEFGNNTVVFEHGPAYLWVATTGYLLYGSIILVAWLASRRSSSFSRRQGRILFYAFLLPLLGNLIYQFEPPELKGMDWTSAFTSVSIILCVWALYGTKLLDLIPIAREKLIDSLSDGMIVLDMQGRIADINHPVAQAFSSTPEKMIGKSLDELLPLVRSLSGYPPEQEIRTEIEVCVAEKRYFDVLVTPLFEKRTQVVGRLIVFREMTIRKQNELRLIQFSRAIEQSPTSIVITDLDGSITYVNPQFSSLTGYTFEEALGKNPSILKSGQTAPEIYREMWQTITSGEVWKGEFLNKKKNGDTYWEQATIAPVLDSDGRIINFIAIKADITKRKRAEEALQYSETLFRAITEQSGEGISLLEDSGKFVTVNPAFCQMTGYSEAELLTMKVNDLLSTKAEPSLFLKVKSGQSDTHEINLQKKYGTLFWSEISGNPIQLGDRSLSLGVARDITERKRMESELERLATTDPLTGAYNRREFARLADIELERARRHLHSTSVIMLDADHFKKINDTYGHAAGDEVLVSLAQLLTREVRLIDLVARYGGEEFMLLLPETALEQACAVAERIRSAVADLSIVVDGQFVHFTISLGVTSSENVGQDLETLFREADRLLYQAKQSGRNRVVSHS